MSSALQYSKKREKQKPTMKNAFISCYKILLCTESFCTHRILHYKHKHPLNLDITSPLSAICILIYTSKL